MSSDRPRYRRMSTMSQGQVADFCKAFAGDMWGDETVADTIIQAMLYFDELPSTAAIQEVVEERILMFPRFRSLIRTDPKLPARRQFTELELSEIKIEDHIMEVTVNGEDEINKLIEREMLGRQMDLSKPAWNLWIIKNTNGLSCLVLNIHHGIGDGVSLMKLQLELLTDQLGNKVQYGNDPRKFKERGPPPKNAWEKFVRWSKSVAKSVGMTVKYFVPAVAALIKITGYVLKGDSQTALHSAEFDRSGKRELVMVPPISVQGLKKCKSAMKDTTLNDLLLGILAGASRQFMKENGNPGTEQGLRITTRCYMPFMLPRKMDDLELHNKFSLVSVRLPVEQKDPMMRIKKSHSAMQGIKNGLEWLVQTRLVKLITMVKIHANRPLAYWLTRNATGHHTFMFSNVPGLSGQDVYLAGQLVKDVRFSMGIPISTCCAVSHNGWMNITFSINPDFCKDTQRLGELMIEETKKICELTGVPVDQVLKA